MRQGKPTARLGALERQFLHSIRPGIGRKLVTMGTWSQMGELNGMSDTLLNRNNVWVSSDKVLSFILVCLKDGGSRLNTNTDIYTILHAREISHNSLNITNELPVVVNGIRAVLPTLYLSCSCHGVVAARLTTERIGSDVPLWKSLSVRPCEHIHSSVGFETDVTHLLDCPFIPPSNWSLQQRHTQCCPVEANTSSHRTADTKNGLLLWMAGAEILTDHLQFVGLMRGKPPCQYRASLLRSFALQT